MTKPYDRGGLPGPTWAERERDSALSRAETAEFRWSQMRERAEQAERDRDGWRDRYRALQAEYARQSQAWSEQRAYYEDRLARAETAKREREAAEARTTPAVPLHHPDGTHMDASHLPIDADDDPAVFVVRESDIEDCQRNEDGDWEFRHSGRVFYDSRDPADRAESLTHHREQVAQRVAIIRAIEAEQADPVEERAREIEAKVRDVLSGVMTPLAQITDSPAGVYLDDLIPDGWDREFYRDMARRALGQEGRR